MKTFSVCILAATLVGCGGAGTEFAKPASTNYADVSTIERIPVVIPKDATTDAHWIIGMGKGYDRLKFKLDLPDDGFWLIHIIMGLRLYPAFGQPVGFFNMW